MNKAKNQTHKDLICGEFSTSHSTPQMCGEWPLHFDPKMADQVKCACSTRVHIIKGLATECKPTLAVWLAEENAWVFEAELSEETTWFFSPEETLHKSSCHLVGPSEEPEEDGVTETPAYPCGREGKRPRAEALECGHHRACGPVLGLPRGSQARGHLGTSPVY